MLKIVECVPNFSEGRSKEIIEAIAHAITSVYGCTMLDIDSGASTNRTVYTFVGSPDDVVKGALSGAMAASTLIDMRTHSGEHPRLGALDVCPFIPVQGVTMDECVQCANKFAEGLALALSVPVYLYGFASSRDYRKTVPQIRNGEYEGLSHKLAEPQWDPDYGPSQFVPSWGATIAGARNFLIAFNINVLGTKEQAHRIALNIREQGRGPEQPGRLKSVQAIGWYLQEQNVAQVSSNITDHTTTPMHIVYEECAKEAKALNLSLAGSEIVGVIPKACILAAADFYMERDNLFLYEEEHKIRLAISRLGLHSIKHFDPKEKLIEYMLDHSSDAVLTRISLHDFVKSVGSRTAVPGGGSVSAYVGALGAALGCMAALLTYGNKKFEQFDSKMRRLIPPLYDTSHQLIPLVDSDSLAYNQFMEANKLPAGTDTEKEIKEVAKKAALNSAIAVPSSVMRMVNQLWPDLKELAAVVNVQCRSDLQVAVRCLETAVWGAYYNVKTNAKDMADNSSRVEVLSSAEQELLTMQTESQSILAKLEERAADTVEAK